MHWWEWVSLIAVVIAAVAGVGAWIVSAKVLRIGRGARDDARKAVEYERLAEARRLISDIETFAGNTVWFRCETSQAQLRGVLSAIKRDLPECRTLATETWNLNTYADGAGGRGLQQQAKAAKSELEGASAKI